MIKDAIIKIVNEEDLTYDEAYAVMNEIMSGETTTTRCRLPCRLIDQKRPRRNNGRNRRLRSRDARACNQGGCRA